MLPWVVASVLALVLLLAIVAAIRSQRQLVAAQEDALAAKYEQIATLESQLASLRESESIRFVDRYVAAKNGLEERVRALHEQLDKVHEQQDQIRTELGDLELTDLEREEEVQRLRRDLMLVSDQARRLESALKEVTSLGLVDVEAIRLELEDRRELAGHIQERLDRLSLHSRDRNSRRLSRTKRLERLDHEVARLRREIDITRAAASTVDGILGIDGDTKRLLARLATERLEGVMKPLDDLADGSPIARFVQVLEKQRPDRLLEQGATERAPEARSPQAAGQAGSEVGDAGEPPPAGSDDDSGAWIERETGSPAL